LDPQESQDEWGYDDEFDQVDPYEVDPYFTSREPLQEQMQGMYPYFAPVQEEVPEDRTSLVVGYAMAFLYALTCLFLLSATILILRFFLWSVTN
jgi:hypothetical protein